MQKRKTEKRNCWECRKEFRTSKDYLWCPRCMKLRAAGLIRSSGGQLNNAMAMSRFYKKELEPGVRGADLIQPLTSEGKPNYDFVERYGTKNFTPEHKEYIRDKFGNDRTRSRE